MEKTGKIRWVGLAAALFLVIETGCVERRFIITSDPPDAIVYMNGQPLSSTPADSQYTYYGIYQFKILKDGFETLVVEQDVKSPWYEIPPLDFISENLLPFTIRDVRHYHYQLKPLQFMSQDELIKRATEMKAQGQMIGPQNPTGSASQIGPATDPFKGRPPTSIAGPSN